MCKLIVGFGAVGVGVAGQEQGGGGGGIAWFGRGMAGRLGEARGRGRIYIKLNSVKPDITSTHDGIETRIIVGDRNKVEQTWRGRPFC